MNNNNNRNNRRRGRGNRNQGSNGAQLNRIDSRARGNAPQMLDKYKKLAQDAHHNGDRVQMEYYLQFADHYFRVIADNKARVDEQRGSPRRPDDRDQAEEYGEDDLDFGSVRRNEPSTRSRYEQQDNAARSDQEEGEQGQEGERFLSDDGDAENGNRESGNRESGNRERGNRDRNDDRGGAQDRPQGARRQPRKARDDNRAERGGEPRAERPERAPRAERTPRTERAPRAERTDAPQTEQADSPRADTPADKPARTRRPRKVNTDAAGGAIDSSILPPSIRGDAGGSGSNGGDTGGTLETVE